jgi:DNA-binding MarR family transcriptional regulator
MSRHQSPRQRLIQAALEASRESSTQAVFFHTSMAERVGLGATEEKTLGLLGKLGPLTAGEIATHTGLTTPSVTGLIDRLERKGMVQRVHDSHDRRRVIVEPRQERLAELDRMFQSVQEVFRDVLDIYSDEQLATITDFLTRSAKRSQEFMASLPRLPEG